MDDHREQRSIDWLSAKRFIFFCVICIVCLGFLSFVYAALLVPISISLFLSFLLLPLVDYFDHLKVPRGLVVSFLLISTLVVVSVAFITIVPSLYRETLELIKSAPKVLAFINVNWIVPLKHLIIETGLIDASKLDQVITDFSGVENVPLRIQRTLTTIWHTAPQVLGTMVNLIMIPLMTFFLLKDYHLIRSFCVSIIPKDLKQPVKQTMSILNGTLRTLIKGQALVAGTLAVLYILGLSLVGVHSSVTIGLIAGVCRFIPYFDVLVGGTLSLIALFSNFDGLGQVLAVVIVFALIQSLDGMFITPRMLGKRVGLHPVVVIVSVISFANLLGFWGVLLAIPIIALAKELYLSLKPFYFASKLYNRESSKKEI